MAKRPSRTKPRDQLEHEQMFSLLSQVSDKMDVLSKDMARLDKKVDLQTQKTEYELKAIRDLDLKQNEILEAHHKRSDEISRDNQLREQALRGELQVMNARVESLEQPRKWLSGTKALIVYLAALSGGVLTLAQAISHFLK